MDTILTTRTALRSNTPLDLSDPDTAWLLESGEADLFLVPTDPQGLVGRRFHVGTIGQGSLMIGAAEVLHGGFTWRLLAVGIDAEATDLDSDWTRATGLRRRPRRGDPLVAEHPGHAVG